MKVILPILIASLVIFCPYTIGGNTLQLEIAAEAASPQDIVTFNTKSLKYHDPQCFWAKKCTVNCIPISRKEAKKRGGIPCKVCNGGEY